MRVAFPRNRLKGTYLPQLALTFRAKCLAPYNKTRQSRRLLEMLKTDRQLRLLEFLQDREQAMRITELSQILHVTPITVRRDVAELSQQGRVLSTRGGVRRRHPH